MSTLLSFDNNNNTATNTNTSDSNDNDDRIQQVDNQNMILWKKYVIFLENQILAGNIAKNTNNNNNTPETTFNKDKIIIIEDIKLQNKFWNFYQFLSCYDFNNNYKDIIIVE